MSKQDLRQKTSGEERKPTGAASWLRLPPPHPLAQRGCPHAAERLRRGSRARGPGAGRLAAAPPLTRPPHNGGPTHLPRSRHTPGGRVAARQGARPVPASHDGRAVDVPARGPDASRTLDGESRAGELADPLRTHAPPHFDCSMASTARNSKHQAWRTLWRLTARCPRGQVGVDAARGRTGA